jgi:hypothetical protein
MDIYLEIGQKKTFAGVLQWPGWSRSGRDETSAQESLFDHAARYAGVLRSTGVDFQPPADIAVFRVVQRLEGNATTSFGAPDIPPALDQHPLDQEEFQRLSKILQACYEAFDAAARTAVGKELRLGPRGGGRDLAGITRHVIEADIGYLARINQRTRFDPEHDLAGERRRVWDLTRQALQSAFQNGLPESGPRGGRLWTLRFFIRRMAWHELDHAWELEDRIV